MLTDCFLSSAVKVVVAASISLPLHTASLVECGNCLGDADADSANGTGACAGEVVEIEADVEGADCLFVVSPGGGESCEPVDCSGSVDRTWSGLPANSTMSWCTIYSTVPLFWSCKRDQNGNPPNAGPSGSGNQSFTETVNCGETNNFTIKTQCGTAAMVSITCSNECDV